MLFLVIKYLKMPFYALDHNFLRQLFHGGTKFISQCKLSDMNLGGIYRKRYLGKELGNYGHNSFFLKSSWKDVFSMDF